MKKLFLFIIILIGIAPELYSQTPQLNTDSLWNMLSGLKGEERLDSLFSFQRRNYETDAASAINSQYLRESVEQQNTKHIIRAYTYMMMHYYLMKSDSVFLLEPTVDSVMLANKDYDGYFRNKGYVLGVYLEKGEYEFSIFKANQVLEDAKRLGQEESAKLYIHEIIGDAYYFSGRYKEAITEYRKMVEAAHSIENSKYNLINIWYVLAISECELKNYEASQAYCDSISDALIEINREESHVQKEWFNIKSHLAYAHLYIATNRLGKAKEELDKAQALVMPGLRDNRRNEIYRYLARYYIRSGQNDKALHLIDSLMPSYKDVPYQYYLQLLDDRGQALYNLGRYDEAYNVSRSYIQSMDSLNSERLTSQMNRLGVMYEVDVLKLEAEKHLVALQRTYIFAGALLVICLLLIAIIIYAVRNGKVLKAKNEKLFSQNQEMDRYLNEIRDLNLLLKRENTQPEEDRSALLFQRISDYLTSTQAYLEPKLTRESLAMELGTNRQYIVEAIQQAHNMSFMDYISDLKLKHARQLLTENKNISIEEAYMLSGFNNKSTFYRLFRSKYGMTPAEMKKIC